ncbi:MAG: hypothetical protein NTZ05_18540 [Chloroflexi bacterium]|nr:hypothetical protein [Chloroflexota bacterium]
MNRPNVLKLSIISGALGALALAACAPSIPPATSTSPAPSANSAAAPAAPATPAAAAAAPTSAPVAAAKPSGTPQPVRIAYQRGGLPVIAKARGELEKSLSQQGIKLEWVGPFPDAPLQERRLLLVGGLAGHLGAVWRGAGEDRGGQPEFVRRAGLPGLQRFDGEEPQ